MNPYHDPKSGRFTTSGGGGKGGSSGKRAARTDLRQKAKRVGLTMPKDSGMHKARKVAADQIRSQRTKVNEGIAKTKAAKASRNTGGPKLRSGATNKARSKSVTVVKSALANAKSSDYGKKLTAAQRSEIKRDIRMKGMTIPGKRTLAQKTYEHLLLQEGYRG